MKSPYAEIFAIMILLSAYMGSASAGSDTTAVARAMSEAAQALLSSLSDEKLEKASHPFDEDRKDWHFVPRPRDGLSLKEMDQTQRDLVFDLLRQGLAEQGVEQVEGVMSLELVLQVLEGRGENSVRDPELYCVWVFGDPGAETWGWRFEGHHISINATVVNGEGVSMTPAFLGANPARVPSGPREGFRALASEEDSAFALVETFDEEQRAQAVFETEAPRDIFTMAERKVQALPIDGIEYGRLREDQRELLRELVDVFLKRNRPAIYEKAIVRIESDGWSKVSFGWAGSIDRDSGNYYFVQGPAFLIEYDNTQNNNNHIHTVWREFEGDFGEDLLQKHHHDHAH